MNEINKVREDHSSKAGQESSNDTLSTILLNNSALDCDGALVGDYFVDQDNSLSSFSDICNEISDPDINSQRHPLKTNFPANGTKGQNTSNCEIEDRNTNKLSNYVYQVLSSTYEGEFLLAAYEFEENKENRDKLLATKKTTYFSKWKVAKLVVNNEFRRTNSFTITPDRFDELALEASKLFPAYFKESFYTRSTKDKNAGRVFQSHYVNQREKECAIGRLISQRKRKNPEELDELALSEELQELQISVQIIDDCYMQKWVSTALQERLSFYSSNDLPHILENFPNLASPTGYNLVQIDFEHFFRKDSNIFEKNWSNVATKVISFAKKRKATDENIKELLNRNTSFKNEEHRQTLALVLLPFLFRKITKQTVRSKTKTNWNPEKTEILKTFILHIESTESFNDCLKNESKQLLDMHNAHKIQLQPFVVINGPTLSNITSAYVVFDKFKYQVSTTTSAVKLCFQSMKVFHEKYSSICNHIWQFLESEVFEMNIANAYSSVVSLKENLAKC